MKCLHTFDFNDLASLSLIRAELDRAGIAYVTRNDGFLSAAGGLPFTECHPEIWILEDADFYRAQRVVREWFSGERRESRPWKCANCGESLDAQFEHCWNCGQNRDPE